jgi:two-component system nitrate/nitrite response regulator NarL
MSPAQDRRGRKMLTVAGMAGKMVTDLPGPATRQTGGRVVVATQADARRRLWIERLQDTFEVSHVAERKSLEHVMARLVPDVLVVDLALPGLGRLRGVPDVQQSSPSTRIVAVTDAPTDSEGLLALKSGVRGYCPRTIDPQQLERAVVAVWRGEIWVPRWLVSGVIAEWLSLAERLQPSGDHSPEGPRLENLTARQRAVADLISRGACNKEIAERLNITERTVKAHLTEAFRAVGVSDRLQLALLVKDGLGPVQHAAVRTPER